MSPPCPPLFYSGRKWLFYLLIAHHWLNQVKNGYFSALCPPAWFIQLENGSFVSSTVQYSPPLKSFVPPLGHSGRKWIFVFSMAVLFPSCPPLGLFWQKMPTTGSFRQKMTILSAPCSPLVHSVIKWLLCILHARPQFIQVQNGSFVSCLPKNGSYRQKMAGFFILLPLVHSDMSPPWPLLVILGRKWLFCFLHDHHWFVPVENGSFVSILPSTG